MLVLTRKQNQTIVIGNGIATITVVEINGRVVRLGVQADKSIAINRGEIQEAKDYESAKIRQHEKSQGSDSRGDA